MKELCEHLQRDGMLKSDKVYKALMSVDRADFSPHGPYEDRPQSISYGVTISAPHMHAYCLELLKDHLKIGGKALDVGFGSGYLTVAMSKMMDDKGCVVGIEHIKDLYDFGFNNISKHHKNLIDNKIIELILGDGRKGYKEKGRFKCIHVGAAALEVPKDLLEQLDFGGRLLMPLGPVGNQYINIIDKDLFGNIKYYRGLSVTYVPLTSPFNQLNNIG